MNDVQRDNQRLDEEWNRLCRTMDEVLGPFRGLQSLLSGEPRQISTGDIEPLVSMALDRAAAIANGEA